MKKTKLNTDGLHPSATFRNGEGLSEHYINCSADPLDLRPAAELIVNRTMAALSELPKNQPLVILMGEEHNTPTHHALQQMVMSRLLDKKQHFTFASEQPHNLATRLTIGNTRIADLPSDLVHQWSVLDKDGQSNLCSYLSMDRDGDFSPVSAESLYAFCYHNKIASVFNDAAHYLGKGNIFNNRHVYLSMKDPFTKATAQQYGKPGQKISAVSREGIAIRNLAMVHKGLSHARKNNARLIVQKTGMAHIFGDVAFNLYGQEHSLFPYKESLCAVYKKAGAAVLPVYLTIEKFMSACGTNHIPEDAYDELKDSIMVDGLQGKNFPNSAMSRIWHREKDYYKKIQEACGGELEFFDVSGNKDNYKSRLEDHAVNIVEAYAAQSNVQKRFR